MASIDLSDIYLLTVLGVPSAGVMFHNIMFHLARCLISVLGTILSSSKKKPGLNPSLVLEKYVYNLELQRPDPALDPVP